MGLVQTVRTAGGHRRFKRSDIERFLRDRRDPADASDAWQIWAELLEHSPALALDGALWTLRAQLGAWHRVADELGVLLGELGRRWESGEISIGSEHVASERLTRSIGRIAGSFPGATEGPRCLLATAEGDEHTLGLSLAELCLRAEGWDTIWLGRRTSRYEISDLADRTPLDMVALSASSASDDAAHLVDLAAAVTRVCREKELLLVLGGEGAWPESPDYGYRIRSFSDFHALLERLAGQP
jgi:methylmalonyl-CoA mutase cobalamin-binding subunit